MVGEIARRIDPRERPKVVNKMRLVEISAGESDLRPVDTLATSDVAQDFLETPSGVVEVTFDSPLVLPPDTEIGERPTGLWRLLT